METRVTSGTHPNGLLFFGVALAFTSGIAARSFFAFDRALLLTLALTALALLFASSIERSRTLRVAALLCFALALGALRLDYAERAPSELSSYIGEEVTVTGRVVREPEVGERTTQFVVRPSGMDELVLASVSREGGIPVPEYGDAVVVEGTMRAPEAFSTNGGRTFDYPGYLKARGIEVTVPFATVAVLARDTSSPLARLYAGKHRFMSAVEAALPMPESGLAEGLLLGVRRALGDDLERMFRETGVVHIVVLSGYNIMVVVAALMHVLTFFLFPRTRTIVGIAAITCFALLVGPSATVVRASIMASLLILAHATGRTYAALRALVIAAILMLIFEPYLLVHDPGFQLSFLATLGLIALSTPVEARLRFLPERFGLRGYATATIATQAFVLPLLLYETGILSLVSVLVNVLVLPVVPLAMLLTFVTGIAGLIATPLGTLVGFFAHLTLAYVIIVVRAFASLPFSSVSLPAFPFTVTLALYGVTALGLFASRRPKVGRSVENEYAGWTIVEEHELARAANEDAASTFPFR
ncbi:MAG TPA: ComEC/Rec2 family competence protein [Candidatus Paceibacterota bacterium]|nr:ComEC/Rec2 family competence protein [Candidatus Paceibacterota bacterium]